MKKQFLSMLILVSAISLRGMDAQYYQSVDATKPKTEAALSRAQARKEPLLEGLKEEQIKRACDAVGIWAAIGKTDSGHSVPQADADYDNHLKDALKIVRGEYKSSPLLVCEACGITALSTDKK